MSERNYEQVLGLARRLGPGEQVRLARELAGPQPLGVLQGGAPAPQSPGWVKAERGHAVLATDTGPAEADIPQGAEAIAGMWADLREGRP